MLPIAPLLRFLGISDWAAITAGIIVVTGAAVMLVAQYRKSQNEKDRKDYFRTGEIRKRRKFFLFGPRTREPKYVPGTKILLSEMRPIKIEDIKKEILRGIDRVDEMATAGHRGGFVPSDQLVALNEAIEGEKNKLTPLQAEVERAEVRNQEVQGVADEIKRAGLPYETISEQARTLKDYADNLARRATAVQRLMGEIARALADQKKNDPLLIKVETEIAEERKRAIEPPGASETESAAQRKQPEKRRKWGVGRRSKQGSGRERQSKGTAAERTKQEPARKEKKERSESTAHHGQPGETGPASIRQLRERVRNQFSGKSRKGG